MEWWNMVITVINYIWKIIQAKDWITNNVEKLTSLTVPLLTKEKKALEILMTEEEVAEQANWK